MKKTISLLAVALMSAAMLSAVTGTAQAATSSVTVKKIATKTAPYNKSVTIKPISTRKGSIDYVRRTLTVKKGKKTVGKNKTSIRLRAGKYTVTTTVKYRRYRTVTKAVPHRVLAFKAGSDVPATCMISEVVSPSDLQASAFDAKCSGYFDGKFLVAGSISRDFSTASAWTVNHGSGATAITLPVGSAAGAASGATYKATAQTDRNLFRMENMPVKARKYSKTFTKSLKQTLVVKQGRRPSRTSPSGWNCPSWAPIKGNASSGIYHVRSGAFYTRTQPEACFSSEKAARNAGYRRSLR